MLVKKSCLLSHKVKFIGQKVMFTSLVTRSSLLIKRSCLLSHKVKFVGQKVMFAMSEGQVAVSEGQIC